MEEFFQKNLKKISSLLQFFPPKFFSWMASVLSCFNRTFYWREWKDTYDVLSLFFTKVSKQQIKRWVNFIFWARALKQLHFFLFPSLTEDTIKKFVIFDPKEIETFFHLQNGNLLVTYHLGNQNWLPCVLSASGIKIHSIRNDRIFWFNHISNSGEIFLPGDGRKIIKKLLNKENIAMTADVFYNTKNKVVVNFLKRKIKWPFHFAKLARLGKAQVYICFLPVLSNGRVKVSIKPLSMPSFQSKFFEQELVKLYVEELEKFVIKSPEQWLRWRFLKQLIIN